MEEHEEPENKAVPAPPPKPAPKAGIPAAKRPPALPQAVRPAIRPFDKAPMVAKAPTRITTTVRPKAQWPARPAAKAAAPRPGFQLPAVKGAGGRPGFPLPAAKGFRRPNLPVAKAAPLRPAAKSLPRLPVAKQAPLRPAAKAPALLVAKPPLRKPDPAPLIKNTPPSSSSSLPALIIVGSTKVGTGPLRQFLAAHSQISAAKSLEENYFGKK